jgi:hypothetical protein
MIKMFFMQDHVICVSPTLQSSSQMVRTTCKAKMNSNLLSLYDFMESLCNKKESRSSGRSWHHRKFWCKDLGIKIFGKILAPHEILLQRSWHHRKFWWVNKFVCNLYTKQVCLLGEQRDICYTPSQKSKKRNHQPMSIFCNHSKTIF